MRAERQPDFHIRVINGLANQLVVIYTSHFTSPKSNDSAEQKFVKCSPSTDD